MWNTFTEEMAHRAPWRTVRHGARKREKTSNIILAPWVYKFLFVFVRLKCRPGGAILYIVYIYIIQLFLFFVRRGAPCARNEDPEVPSYIYIV